MNKATKEQQNVIQTLLSTASEEDWEAILNFTKHYFAAKATAEMDKLFEENGWGDEKIQSGLTRISAAIQQLKCATQLQPNKYSKAGFINFIFSNIKR